MSVYITLKTLEEIRGKQYQLGLSTQIVDKALTFHKKHGHLSEENAKELGLAIKWT